MEKTEERFVTHSLKKFDLFGQPYPAFNLRGKNEINTFCGSIVSIVIIYIVIMFGSLKFAHLLSHHGPTINTYTQKNAFTSEDIFNSEENDFMVAVTLEDYFT